MRPLSLPLLARVSCAIAALLGVAGCKRPALPSFAKSICGYVAVGGKQIAPDNPDPDCASVLVDAGTTPLTVGAIGPQFVAFVNVAAGGPWQLTVMADGAFTTGGDGGQSIAFVSNGDQVPIIVPLTFLSGGGQATIRAVVGDTARNFQFFINRASGSKTVTCFQLAGNDAGSEEFLAWTVKPPQPATPSDSDGGSSSDAATGVGTLTVDLRVALTYCADAGMAVLDVPVSVQGTGGLVPTTAILNPDSDGRVLIELTGPAVSDSVAVVLTTSGGGSLLVTATRSDFGL